MQQRLLLLLCLPLLAGCYTSGMGQRPQQEMRAEIPGEREAARSSESQRRVADARKAIKAVSFGVGFGRGEFADPETGFVGLVLGGVLGVSPLFVTGNLHADLVMTEEDSGYRWDQGIDRCQNSRTGRFAESASCGAGEFFFAATADANYRITASGIYLGAGYRAGTLATPYLSGGWLFSPLDRFSLGLRGKLWTGFADFSMLFTIPL